MNPPSEAWLVRFWWIRSVYGTITLMSALIIYDGWQHLRLIDVVGVIVGPMLAEFLGHVFSALMAKHVGIRLAALQSPLSPFAGRWGLVWPLLHSAIPD